MHYEAPALRLRFGHGAGTLTTPSLAESEWAGTEGISAESVLRYLPFVEDPVAIFFAGSHTLGWNHAKSDLDLYVVTAEAVSVDRSMGDVWTMDAEADGTTISLLLGTLGPFRTDIEFWRQGQLDAVLDALPAPNSLELAGAVSNSRDLLDKLKNAQPVLGEEWLRTRQKRIATSGLARALAYKHMIHVQGSLEDVDGFLTSGDVSSAVLAVRAAFESAVDALLLTTGSITPQPKWRARRVQEANDPALEYEAYWEVTCMARLDPGAPADWVVQTARLTHELLIETAVRVG